MVQVRAEGPKGQKQHALKGVWLGASALYLCFTLRPAIFNSLRPVTVGSGRVEPTCETSVNHVFLKENLSLSKSTAKEEVCTVGLFEDRL